MWQSFGTSSGLLCQVKPDIEAAGIPLPPADFPIAARSSYTVTTGPRGSSSVGVLWKVDQLYVSKVMNVPLAAEWGKPGINNKGGMTISVRKFGGWQEAYKKAVALANPA